jgi:2-(1,2-epoxy-1,2-dihydrophenyl)acetyl-CoA isomerase
LDELRVDRAPNGVVTLTLNRPELRNAVSEPMWDGLRAVFEEVARRDADRVLVITGAGGAFCAGAQLGERMAEQHPLVAMRAVNAAALALHDLPKPTIAKVGGVAVGAGMNLALGCDLVVAGRSARFSQIFARRALSVDFGGTWLLPRLVGLHKAKELALLGEILPAEEAERLGVVNRVVDDHELDAFVAAWADRLAAGPPLALELTKRMLQGSLSLSMHEALQWEAAAQSVNLESADTREGVRAFLEKRAPVFRGR